MWWILGLTLAAAQARDAPAPDPYADLEEVVVRPEAWARWDETRWRVDTQIMLPYPMLLATHRGGAMAAVAIDLHYVIRCEIGSGGVRKRAAVECLIEDVALQAAPWARFDPGTSRQVDAVRDLLVGMNLRLRVHVDGRVTRVDLDGAHSSAMPESFIYDDVRKLLSLSLAGFHLRTPQSFGPGEMWVDRQDMVLAPPVFTYLGIMPTPLLDRAGMGAGAFSGELLMRPLGVDLSPPPVSFRGPQRGVPSRGAPRSATQSSGYYEAARRPSPSLGSYAGRRVGAIRLAPAPLASAIMKHRMRIHEGHYVVESEGKGSFDMGSGYPLIFRGSADAVSVFDGDLGIMTERVWAVQMQGDFSQHNRGIQGWPYAMIGRLAWLDPDAPVPDLGPTGLVRPPRYRGLEHLPPWPAPR